MFRVLLCIFMYALSSCLFASVPGWPANRIAMGSIVDGGNFVYQKLLQRPVDSIFTYAGINGAGDRGYFVTYSPTSGVDVQVDNKVPTVMKQARSLETATQRPVQPVIVFYTVDGSDGVWSIQQDLDIDPASKTQNLYLHYANLIRLCQELESFKDATHPHPATILLNPDFLGELHKQCSPNYCPIPPTQTLQIGTALANAIAYLKQNGYLKNDVAIPPQFQNNQASMGDYVMSINWIIKNFGPDLAFGWQDNIWAGDQAGHLWVHQAVKDPAIIQKHVNDEINFLNQLEIFNRTYPQSFIAFDKWERDVFDSTLGNAGLNNGYLYNTKDWDVYMNFVTQISNNFSGMPVMLWQIPGGHLQLQNDIDARNDHASTAPDYFLGDKDLQACLKNVKPYIAVSTINPNNYFVSSNSASVYLTCQNEHGCWAQNRLPKLQNSNVFAILWGGGSTTGVAGLSTALDDNGWLYQKIKSLGK